MSARRKPTAASASGAQPAPPPSNASMAPAEAAAVAAAVAEWRELRERIERFNSLPDEVLRQVAKSRIYWPIMAGRGKVQTRDQDALLERIDLGSGVPIRECKRQGERKIPDVANPINDAARLCLLVASDDRARGLTDAANLPELSPETARVWAIHCWDDFLEMFPTPETDATWKTYGTHRKARHTGRKPHRRVETAELRGVRDGIREAFIAATVRQVR